MTARWGPVRRKVENYLQRIDKLNGDLNALITPTPAIAREAADAADHAAADRRNLGALHGMVIALKDNIDTADIRTSSGSKLFQHYVPQEDAEVWRVLREQGAILIGKAGLHECVFGATSQNQWFGRIRNPWNTDFIPGGSSGGSGAALAADFCDIALGTDTGGSVRIPAAMCGIAGLRPTMGAVSNRAVRPISPHLDTVGPMARKVSDIAKAYAVMRVYDHEDETSRIAPSNLDFSELHAGVKGLRIGVPRSSLFYRQLHPAVADAVERAISVFADLGAEIITIGMEFAKEAAHACSRIIVADAADYYGRFLEKAAACFSEQTKLRMRTGYDVSGVEYAAHMRRMYRWRRVTEMAFDQVDLILTPTLPIPALPIAECEDLLESTQRITPFTMAWSLASVPNLALPCGFSAEGLPVSCQLAASRWNETKLLRAGNAFQKETDFHLQKPKQM